MNVSHFPAPRAKVINKKAAQTSRFFIYRVIKVDYSPTWIVTGTDTAFVYPHTSVTWTVIEVSVVFGIGVAFTTIAPSIGVSFVPPGIRKLMPPLKYYALSGVTYTF